MDGCNSLWRDAPFSFYRYKPSLAGNTVFIVLFGITTSLHAFQLVRSRSWYLVPFLIGGICETVGYIGRAVGALEDPGCWTLEPFVVQSILLLIAPAFMAATIYMTLGRIILLTQGEHHSLIKRRWLTKLFVFGDVLALFTQSAGAGIMPIDHDLIDMGEYIIIAGLFIQLAFFGAFIVIAGLFHWRMLRSLTSASRDPNVRWQAYLTILYVSGILIWVRSLFRAIEYIDGNNGPLMRSEVFVFTLDGLLMIIVMVYMNWFHPSEIGLLLQGKPPIRNGLELLFPKSRFIGSHRASESLSSAIEMVDTSK